MFARFGSHGIMEYLLDQDCPLDSQDVFEAAIRSGNLEIVKRLYEKNA